MYHRFPAGAAARGAFAAQLDHVHTHFKTALLDDVVTGLREGRKPEPHTLSITVDDGHRDFYDVAYPALKSHNIPATVFLTTGFLDGQGWLWFDRIKWLFGNARAASIECDLPGAGRSRFTLETPEQRSRAGAVVAEAMTPVESSERDLRIAEMERSLGVETPRALPPEFAPLQWDEVREMARNGIAFGAHTVTHPTLSTIPDRARIDWELAESKRRVEQETQREASVFCYPNGRDEDISEPVLASVRATGFLAAVQTEPGLNTAATDLFRLRRMAAETGYDTHYFERVCAVMRR